MRRKFKKIASIVLTIAMVLTLMPSMAFATEEADVTNDESGASTSIFAAGTGTSDDPYQIATLDQLKAFRDSVNGGESYSGKFIKLTDDIDLGGEATPWTPIGGNGKSFDGTFDGQYMDGETAKNHTISNLYVHDTSTSAKEFGLFGRAVKATVKNLNIVDPHVYGNSAVAVVAGESNGTFENVHVSGNITIGTTTNQGSQANYNSSYIGGIVGHSYPNPTIRNCSVIGSSKETSKIIGGRQVAGIVGFTCEVGQNSAVADGCTVKNITIEGTKNVAGIVGWLYGNDNHSAAAEKVLIKDCAVENIEVHLKASAETDSLGLISGGSVTTAVNKTDCSITYSNNTATDSVLKLNDEVQDYGDVINRYSKYGSVCYATDNNGTYEFNLSLAGALNKSNGFDNIVLNTTTSELITIPEGRTITLDLGGNTLYGDPNNVAITNNGTLAVKNGSLDGVTGEGSYTPDSTVSPYTVPVIATITKESETKNYATVAAALNDAENGDTIVLQNNTTESFAVKKNITIDLKGHTITGTESYTIYNNAELTVTDSAEGGKIIGSNYAVYMNQADDKLIVQNGTLQSTMDTSGYYGVTVRCVDSGASVEVYGGSLICADNSNWYHTTIYGTSNITITGGTFTKINSSWLTDRYEAQENTDGSGYTVVKVYDAAIGDQIYETIVDALSAVDNDEEITLLRDIRISDDSKINNQGIITISDKTFTINGDDHTITAAQTTENSKKASVFNVENTANITFKNLTIDGNKNANHGINIFKGTAALENVTLKNLNGHGMVVQGTATAENLTAIGNGWGGVNVDVASSDVSSTFTLKSGTVQSVIVEHSNPNTTLISSAVIEGGAIGSAFIQKKEGDSNVPVTSLDGASLEISGGIFSTDPSAYCTEGKTGVANTDSNTSGSYAFMVAVKKNPTVSTDSKKESASVSIPGDVDNEVIAELESVSTALTGADVVTGSGLDAAVATQVDNNTITASALDDNIVSDIVSDSKPKEDLNIVVQYYMDVTLKEVKTEDDSSKTLKVDITPMVQTVATTAAADEAIKLEDSSAGANDKNAVVVKPAEKLTITSPVTVTLPLPAGFASVGDTINIQHNHSTTGKTYVYTATVQKDADNNLFISFVNPNGFSEFILGVAAPAAKIGTVGYKTLQDAVNDVKDSETITLNADCSEVVTISKNLTFTLDKNGKTFDHEAGLIAGSRTDRTITAVTEGSVYTYTFVRRSGGGSGGSADVPAVQNTISVPKAENGTVSLSSKTAEPGAVIIITATPAAGYEVKSVTVTDKDGKTVAVTEKDGKYLFTMPKTEVTVKAEFAKKEESVTPSVTFTDVPADAYYAEAVAWAVENGITTGMTETTFAPEAACTRAQMITFLWRAAGCPEVTSQVSFSDVSADAYYAKAVAWAVANGITQGMGDGTFGSDLIVTRSQVVTFQYRMSGEAASAGSTFSDVPSDAYYAEAVAWAVENGITTGMTSDTFAPEDNCTRGQIVTFLYRDAK